MDIFGQYTTHIFPVDEENFEIELKIETYSRYFSASSDFGPRLKIKLWECFSYGVII